MKADDKSKTYDGEVFTAFTSSITGFVNGETETGLRTSGALTGAAAYSGAATTAVNASATPYAITPTTGTLAATNYSFMFVNGQLTINKKAASVTPAAAGKTYGDADPTFTGTLVGFLAADNVTATYSRTTGETVAGSPYTISATLSPAGVLANYDITSNTAMFDISKKTASVTPNGASKTYGDADPTFTGTLVGFLAADNVTATYSRTTGETVAGSPYTISATLSPAGVLANYDITSNTAMFDISKKTASVTPNGASKTYGDADPTFTGTLVGFLAADNVTATYSRTTGETVAGSPYTISATLSPAGVLANYDIASNTAMFDISKKTASVTPNGASKTYGDADPTFTGTLVGFLAADNVTATYSRTTGETVAGSPYTISATLSPAGVLANYSITSNTAGFTITKAPLTVKANDKTKLLHAPNPPFDASYSGLVNGDTPAALGGTHYLHDHGGSGRAQPGGQL